MKHRSPSSYLFSNPCTIWVGLALKTGEMMMASASVINHRTRRMAAAGPIPNARDQREFTLMNQEKIDAVTESAQAIAARMITVNQTIGTMAFKQMLASTTGMFSLAVNPNLAESGKLQAQMVRDAVSHSAATASHLADSVAQVAHKGLKPVHSRATANAKRLGKLKA